MKFGYFDDANHEYVITTPNTPSPWINYLGQEDFFSLISNTAGGYSFYKDAKLRRLTRYRYNNVPQDSDGRHFYVKDGDLIWSPTFLPKKTPLDFYECRHGQGYSVFQGRKNGLSAELTCFVPAHDPVEIQFLVLKNESQKAKDFSLFSQLEWCLWNASDDSENFQRNYSTGEVEVEGKAIYHKTEFRERRNHYAFYSSNLAFSHFETDRDAFLGRFGDYSCPEEVLKGKLQDGMASGWRPIAAEQFDLHLETGQRVALIFLLGYVEIPEGTKKFVAPHVINKAPALSLMEKYQSEEQVKEALNEVKRRFSSYFSVYQARTGNEKLDRMANVWNPYQSVITYCMSRSASYYESGIGRGMGFRDSCQDLLGFVSMIPEKARERIKDIASIQKKDGSTYHQYQPLTKRGNSNIGSGFNDDPLWLLGATAAYLKETGDFAFLDELVPFDNEEGSEKPLLDHLKASFEFTTSHLGPHGLPLIGRADWNDCLNLNCFSSTPGESFQTTENKGSGKVAESVFIAGMFVLYGGEYAKILSILGKKEEAEKAAEDVRKVEKAAEVYGWDGAWYLRAYDAYGHKVGSKECEEGKIFIEPQGFCSLAQIGEEKGYPKKAIASSFEYLLDDYGLELLYPPYSVYHLELGEISSYPEGYKENGAVFNHNNPWVICAACLEDMRKEAYDLYTRNSPAFIEDKSEVHYTEPYVYSQMIAGRFAPRFGQAKNSWLTGSATWSLVTLQQYLLGVRPDYDGLLVEPRLPIEEYPEYEVTRKFRGATYHIHIHNSEKPVLYVNGKKLEGNKIPLAKQGDVVEVEVR